MVAFPTVKITRSDNGADGYLAFYTESNRVAGDNDLYWDRVNNRLGIHTTTPNEVLTIDGSFSLAEQGEAPSATSGFGKLYVKSSDNDLHFIDGSGVDYNLTPGGTPVGASQGFDGYIAFFTGNNSIAGDNDLYWDRVNNRLGIHTTTPQNLLDVAGGVVIGSTYAGISTAPQDGLRVEGSLTVGNTFSLGVPFEAQRTSASGGSTVAIFNTSPTTAGTYPKIYIHHGPTNGGGSSGVPTTTGLLAFSIYNVGIQEVSSIESYCVGSLGSYFSSDLIFKTQNAVGGAYSNRMRIFYHGGVRLGTGSLDANTGINSMLHIEGGGLLLRGASAPPPPNVAVVGATGSTTWAYKVATVNINGETLTSGETVITNGNSTLDGSNYNAISLPSHVENTISYRIYRTKAGGTPSTTGYIGSSDLFVSSFNDTGLTARAPEPTQDTSNSIFLDSGNLNTAFGGFGKYENQIPYSEDFTTWSASGVTVTINDGYSPDGAKTANTLISSGGTLSTTFDTNPSPAHVLWTGSVWLRSISGNVSMRLRLDANGQFGNNNDITVTGAWKRFFMLEQFTSSGNNPMVFNIVFLASGTIQAWGAQVERGYRPGVYISTNGQAINQIGRGLVSNSDDNVILGKLGINTTSPQAQFHVAGDGYFDGYLMPFQDDTWGLGTPDKRWRDLYLGPGSLHLRSTTSQTEAGVERDWALGINADGNLRFKQGDDTATATFKQNQLILHDGSSAVPSLAFAALPTSGFYQTGSAIELANNGVSVMNWNTTGTTQAFGLLLASGTFQVTTSRTKLFSPADGRLQFSNNAFNTGAQLDFTTQNTVKIRSFDNGEYGTFYAADGYFDGYLMPNQDDMFGLGTPDKRWRDLYLGPGSLHIQANSLQTETNAVRDWKLGLNSNGNLIFTQDGEQYLELRDFDSGNGTVVIGPYHTSSANYTASTRLVITDGTNGAKFDFSSDTLTISTTSATGTITINPDNILNLASTNSDSVNVGRTTSNIPIALNGLVSINIAPNIPVLSVTQDTGLAGATLDAYADFGVHTGSIFLKERLAPQSLSGYGKLYVSSSDNDLHFLDSLGADVNLTSGGSPVAASQGSDGYLTFFTSANTIAGDNDLFWDRANNRLGIHTTSPQNFLDVAGGVVFGSTYAGSNTAPVNGLLVEGSVGIGTNSPQTTLHVAGDGYFDGYLMPFTDNVHWLGTPDKRWESIFLGPNSLHIKQNAAENDTNIERDWNITIQSSGRLVFQQGADPYLTLRVPDTQFGTTTPAVLLHGRLGSITHSATYLDLGDMFSVRPGAVYIGANADVILFPHGLSFSGSNGALNVRAPSGIVKVGVNGQATNTFDVFGQVGIGINYAAITAPTNGMIIEGRVGIATSNPQAQFHVAGDGYFDGYLMPFTDDTWGLGTPDKRWRDLYLGPGSIHIQSSDAQTGVAREWNIGIQSDGSLRFRQADDSPLMIVGASQIGGSGNRVTFPNGIVTGDLNNGYATIDAGLVAHPTAGIAFRSRTSLYAPSASQLKIANEANNIGIILDTATQNTLKVRTFDNGEYGTFYAADGYFDGYLMPNQDDMFGLGTPQKRWRDLYVGPGSIHIQSNTTDWNLSIDDVDNLTLSRGPDRNLSFGINTQNKEGIFLHKDIYPRTGLLNMAIWFDSIGTSGLQASTGAMRLYSSGQFLQWDSFSLDFPANKGINFSTGSYLKSLSFYIRMGSDTVTSSHSLGMNDFIFAQAVEVDGTIYADSNAYIAGNFGVGTTSPSAKFHVAGDGYFDGYLMPFTDDTWGLGTPDKRWRDLYLGPGSLHFVASSSQTDVAREWNIGLTSDGSLNIRQGEDSAVLIDPLGVAGFQNHIALKEIATPSQLSSYGKLYVNSSDNDLHFIDSSGVDVNLTPGGQAVSSSQGADGYITFYTSSATIAGDNDLFWDRGNNKLRLNEQAYLSATSSGVLQLLDATQTNGNSLKTEASGLSIRDKNDTAPANLQANNIYASSFVFGNGSFSAYDIFTIDNTRNTVYMSNGRSFAYASGSGPVWYSGTMGSSALDTSLYRVSAGVIRVSDGQSGGGTLELYDLGGYPASGADASRLYSIKSGGKSSLVLNTEQVLVDGYILPSVDDAYGLGTATNRWRNLYVGPGSIHIMSGTGQTDTGVERDWNLGINSTGDLRFRQGGDTKLKLDINNTLSEIYELQPTGTGGTVFLSTGTDGRIGIRNASGSALVYATVSTSPAGITFSNTIYSNSDIAVLSGVIKKATITTSGFNAKPGVVLSSDGVFDWADGTNIIGSNNDLRLARIGAGKLGLSSPTNGFVLDTNTANRLTLRNLADTEYGSLLVADGYFDGYLMPNQDDMFGLGTPDKRWRDLYLGPGSLHIVSTDSQTQAARDWNFGINSTGLLKINQSDFTSLLFNLNGISVPSGTASLPGLSFISDFTSGLFSAGTGHLSLSLGGNTVDVYPTSFTNNLGISNNFSSLTSFEFNGASRLLLNDSSTLQIQLNTNQTKIGSNNTNGQLKITNAAGTSGAIIDAATINTFKIRSLDDGEYGTFYAADGYFDGYLMPNQDDMFGLGTPQKRWRDLYLGPGSLHIQSGSTDWNLSIDDLDNFYINRGPDKHINFGVSAFNKDGIHLHKDIYPRIGNNSLAIWVDSIGTTGMQNQTGVLRLYASGQYLQWDSTSLDFPANKGMNFSTGGYLKSLTSYIRMGSSSVTTSHSLSMNDFVFAQAVEIDGLLYADAGVQVIGNIALQESNAPSGLDGYGKIYVLDDGELYYKKGNGSEIALSVDTGSAPLYSITGSKTSSYTASFNEVVRADPSGGGFTITLPLSSGGTGKTIIIKNTTNSSNTITIDTTAGETIDGSLTATIFEAYKSITFISYGDSWGRI